jgi:hypothetical protein
MKANLANCRNIGDASVRRLVGLAPNLTELVLAGIRLDNYDTFVRIKEGLPNLRHLDLSRTGMPGDTFELSGVNVVQPSVDVVAMAANNRYTELMEAVRVQHAFPGVIPTESAQVTPLASVIERGNPMSPNAPVLQGVLDVFKVLIEVRAITYECTHKQTNTYTLHTLHTLHTHTHYTHYTHTHHTPTQTQTHTHTHAHTRIDKCTHVHTHTHTHIRAHTHTYTYTYTCVHTHTHTHIHQTNEQQCDEEHNESKQGEKGEPVWALVLQHTR